jgi:sigma-B regulation protein RsbU (phosphoserine phosphatase)
MFRSIISKIPIKISVPLLLTVPVFSVVLILSVIAWIDGKSTANDLMEQNMIRIHDRTEERLKELLNLPKRIQLINTNLIGKDLLRLNSLRSWRQILFYQIQAFNGLSSITWGSADGRSVGIAHNADTVGYEFSIKDEQTGKNLQKYYCDAQGQMDKKPIGISPYDPRDQPWYIAAIKDDKSTWADAYPRVRKGGSGISIALGFAQPFRDNDGQILGVMNVELTLDDVRLFLARHSVGSTGKVFLIDQKGRLIATSTGFSVTDINNYPLLASVSADRHIAAAAKHIEAAFKSLKSIDARYQLRIKINGKPHLLMISPLEHGTNLSWIITTLVPESDFLTEIKAGHQRSIKIGLIAVLITIVLGIVLASISLWPMLDLVAYVQRVGQGNLEDELKLEYSTEFVQLSKEINAMTAGLRDRMRLCHSLDLAHEVQQNLLPSDTPKIDGLDIASHCKYCDETGGDYFDFLNISGLPPTTAAIAVGDVVGHGVAAAMLMATARGILRSRCQKPGSLPDLLAHLNNLLVEVSGGDRFMSMLLMTVDAQRKEMRWSAAGHDAPIVYDPVVSSFVDLKSKSVSLGLMKDINYREQHLTPKEGQIFIALTDGLSETFNKDGVMFGKERVCNLIRQYAHLSAAELTQEIEAQLTRFRGESSPEDDHTFVIVKVL